MSADFRAVRLLYGETQAVFAKRLGWTGPRASLERKVRRYEKGETPVVGPLGKLIEHLAERPESGRRSKPTATKGKP